jgi:hypothetical protein
VFKSILESSRLPLTISQALHGSGVNNSQFSSWRGCLARSLLGGDVFPHGVMRWTGYPPPTLAYGAWPPIEGVGLACEALSGLVSVVVNNVCWGKGSFPRRCYRLEVLSLLVPAHGISHSKMGSSASLTCSCVPRLKGNDGVARSSAIPRRSSLLGVSLRLCAKATTSAPSPIGALSL